MIFASDAGWWWGDSSAWLTPTLIFLRFGPFPLRLGKCACLFHAKIARSQVVNVYLQGKARWIRLLADNPSFGEVGGGSHGRPE